MAFSAMRCHPEWETLGRVRKEIYSVHLNKNHEIPCPVFGYTQNGSCPLQEFWLQLLCPDQVICDVPPIGQHQTQRSMGDLRRKGIGCCRTWRNHASTCQAMPTHAKPTHANTCQVMPTHANTCQVMPTHAKSCQVMPSHANTCQAVPSHAKSCQTMPRHANTV